MSTVSIPTTIKSVCCIGAGYVGGPSSAVLALQCPTVKVTVCDADASKIAAWSTGVPPIYEPGLEDVVKQCLGKNLFFSTDVATVVTESDVIFISVNTPTKEYGQGKGRACDITNLEKVARTIGAVTAGPKIVVEKSTVPVRAAESIRRILSATSKFRHQVLSNPEFLAEGTAIKDLTHPDRVLIGGDEHSVDGQRAIQALVDLYAQWIPREKVLTTNTWSSELSKLAANAFLAQRIAAINAIGCVCEETGADVGQVARAVGADSRLGPHFLNASVGFGGSCFKKDIYNLVYLSECLHLEPVASFFMAILRMNDFTKSRFAEKVVHKLFGTVRDKHLAILGFSFKANTGDTRDSPAIHVCRSLLAEGALLHIYDPKVTADQMKRDLSPATSSCWSLEKQLIICNDPYDALTGAHALLVCTEWASFRELDYNKVYQIMQRPAFVFDGRRILDAAKLSKIGFHVERVGEKPVDRMANEGPQL